MPSAPLLCESSYIFAAGSVNASNQSISISDLEMQCSIFLLSYVHSMAVRMVAAFFLLQPAFVLISHSSIDCISDLNTFE